MLINRTRCLATAALLALAFGAPATAAAAGGDRDVFVPQSQPYGKAYSEWAAAWWTWVVRQPTPVNPLLDTTGANCAQGQSGRVWFLAGTFTNGASITRACTIPTGTSVLFPVVNRAYFGFLNDPPEERTEEFVRSRVAGVAAAQDLRASLDGTSVPGVERWFEESALFRVVLPVDNILGVEGGTGPGQAPGLVMDPSGDAGFYLMLKPLSPGDHTVRFSGRVPRPGRPDFTVDITYRLTVTPH